MTAFTRDATWTCQFPISLAVEGPDCYRRMADMGIGRNLFCAMIYAPYRFLLPRYPEKGLYSMEEGRYHYKPETARYQGLPFPPAPALDWGDRDLVAESVDGARQAGVSPGVWVTTFASGHIAKNHPDWAYKNLFGSADRLLLCFNHPEAREYSMRVCEEIAQRYDVDEIMLDKIPQQCMDADALSGRIDPVLRTLGSICFCPHCISAAEEDGLNLSACRQQALALAKECLAIPPHVVNAQRDHLKGDTEAPLLLLDHPWVMEILRWRVSRMLRFHGELRQRLDAVRKGIALTAAFVPPVKVGHDAIQPLSWLGVQNYRAYRDVLDRIHSVIHWEPEVVEYDTRRAVAAVAGSSTRITTHVRALGATRPEQMPALADAAKRGGAHGICYFCYDMMSDDMIAALTAL